MINPIRSTAFPYIMAFMALIWVASRAQSQTSASLGCPVVGDTREPKLQSLNVLKNRTTAPKASDFDSSVTMGALLKSGRDQGRFDTRRAARIVGYVADVKVGGVESVNCHAKGALDRDTHIELTISPNNPDESLHVIVETTPRWRAAMAKQGVDWSTSGLRRQILGRWVEVEGWLLYDEEHEANAAHTHRGRARVWRATVWEIHPVTSLKVGGIPPRRP